MPRREKIKVGRAELSLPGALAPGWFAASRRVRVGVGGCSRLAARLPVQSLLGAGP